MKGTINILMSIDMDELVDQKRWDVHSCVDWDFAERIGVDDILDKVLLSEYAKELCRVSVIKDITGGGL